MIPDKIDLKLLWYLEQNSRMPLSQLAKAVGLSKQNVHYRLQRLIREKILLGCMSIIDIHQLGYLTHRVYLRYKHVDAQKEQQILEYFQNHDRVIWSVSMAGAWDLEVVFVAENFIQFNNLLKKMKEELGQYFSKYDLSMSVVNYHFQRDYLIGKKREQFAGSYYGFEPTAADLDTLDVQLLTILSQNCRQSNQEIGKQIGVSYHTVKDRIRKLEQRKIIQSHRTHIALGAIGRKYYKARITLGSMSKKEEQRLYAFCSQYTTVVYLIEVLGEWQFEIEAEVTAEEEFLELLRAMRNAFPDSILDYDILRVTKEHKLNYLPMGTGLLKR